MDKRKEFRSCGEEALRGFQIERRAIFQHRHKLDFCAGIAGEFQPGQQVAVVFHFRQKDRVTSLDVFATPGVGDEIDRLGGSARKNDLLLARGIQQFCDTRPGVLIGCSRAFAEKVDSTMHVGIFALHEPAHAADHTCRLLRTGRVVEVDQWVAVHGLLQKRKLLADCRKIHWRGKYSGIRLLRQCVESSFRWLAFSVTWKSCPRTPPFPISAAITTVNRSWSPTLIPTR